MKYIDLAVQTLLIVGGAVLLAYTYGENGWPSSILVAQLALGPWQYFGGLVTVLSRGPQLTARRRYLAASTVYLLALLVGARVDSKLFALSQAWILAALIVPAWALALHYYYLTWQWVQQKETKRGSFLPNINF